MHNRYIIYEELVYTANNTPIQIITVNLYIYILCTINKVE